MKSVKKVCVCYGYNFRRKVSLIIELARRTLSAHTKTFLRHSWPHSVMGHVLLSRYRYTTVAAAAAAATAAPQLIRSPSVMDRVLCVHMCVRAHLNGHTIYTHTHQRKARMGFLYSRVGCWRTHIFQLHARVFTDQPPYRRPTGEPQHIQWHDRSHTNVGCVCVCECST